MVGSVGTASPEFDEEYPVWRLVHAGHALSEVLKWDLDDLIKANCYLDMMQAYDSASTEYQQRKQDRATK